jgi:hypothetical protein
MSDDDLCRCSVYVLKELGRGAGVRSIDEFDYSQAIEF